MTSPSSIARHAHSGIVGRERRRSIARALASNPSSFWTAFAGIDPIAIGEIRSLVAKLTGRGLGVLITDRNVRETLGIIDRAVIIHDGQVLMEGSAEEIVEHPEVRVLSGFGICAVAIMTGQGRVSGTILSVRHLSHALTGRREPDTSILRLLLKYADRFRQAGSSDMLQDEGRGILMKINITGRQIETGDLAHACRSQTDGCGRKIFQSSRRRKCCFSRQGMALSPIVRCTSTAAFI